MKWGRVLVSAVAVGAVVIGTRLAPSASARTVTVRPGELHPRVAARAVVAPVDGIAHVLAFSPGHATRVAVHAGDRVRAGDVLATIRPRAPGPDEELVAPVDGTVLSRNVDPGDTVGVLPTALFEITDSKRLELRIEIEERDAARIQLGARVRWGDVDARIERLAPSVERREDALADVTARATSRVRLAWAALPEGARALVGEHVIASVELPAAQFEALVPRDAVVLRDGHAVLRVRRGLWTDEVRAVLGASDDEHVAVVGVAAGTEVMEP